MLIREEKRLLGIKKIVEERLVEAPEGTLRINGSNNQVQFGQYLEDEGKVHYISKDNLAMASKLAQKTYDEKVKKLVDRRLKQLGKLSSEYEDNEIEELYDMLHPMRQGLVEAVEKPWEERLAEWKSIPYIGKPFDEKTPEIYTKKGERVRSKSEKIIADTFNELGIEYKYECPINLKGFGIVYPDFTILRKRDGKIIYWEHDGRMGDPRYVDRGIRKINSYIANNIFPGETLILSFESEGTVLNDRVIMQLIKKHIF